MDLFRHTPQVSVSEPQPHDLKGRMVCKTGTGYPPDRLLLPDMAFSRAGRDRRYQHEIAHSTSNIQSKLKIDTTAAFEVLSKLRNRADPDCCFTDGITLRQLR